MIMEAICRGNFCPTENVKPQDADYRKEWKLVDDLVNTLKERLNDEDFDLVRQAMDHAGHAYCIESEEFFKLGLATGLQLKQEAEELLHNINK